MEPILSFGGADITILELIIGALLALIGLLVGLFARRRSGPDPISLRLQEELGAMRAEQTALQGRLAQMSEDTAKRGDLFQKSLDERLSSMTERMGRSLSEQSERSALHLKGLHTRLEVIDRAQANIKELAGEVSGLQSILSNKQSRGAFGEQQMQNLISQLLPPNAYSFQQTLSNRSRVDALIHLPGEHLDVAVDSKFPLESWQRLTNADNTPHIDAARKQFARDCLTHIKAIADKYLITGETYEVAIMFVPSEAIFAELHTFHQDSVINTGFNRRVVVVSPTTFMATLHTMNSVIKDAAVQEQAALIKRELVKLKTNIGLLDDRIKKLQKRYTGMGNDLKDIDISAGKIMKNASTIERVEIETPASQKGQSGGSSGVDLQPPHSSSNLL